MKKLRLLLISVLFSAIAYAQNTFNPGYVVKLNGDTLKGFVNYRVKSLTPRVVQFKSSANGAVLTFKPGMLKAFEAAGIDTYLTYTGRISLNRNKFPEIDQLLDTTTVQDTIFLRVAYSGKEVSLLQQRDAIKQRLFVMETGRQPVELDYYEFYDSNTSNQVRNIDIYKNTLRALAQKYNSTNGKLQGEIGNAVFAGPVINNIVKHINGDDNAERKTFKVSFAAGAAYGKDKISFDGETIFNGQSNTANFLRLNAGIEVQDTVYLKHFHFRADLSYHKVNHHIFYRDVAGAASIVNEYAYQFTRNVIALTPRVNYDVLNARRASVYAGVGITVSYSFYSNDYITRNGSASADTYMFRRTTLSLPLQAGIYLGKKLNIYAEYALPAPISYYGFVSIYTQTFSAGINYHFR